MPGAPLWLVQGRSSIDWLGNALPFHLLPFGAPNCHLRVSVEILRDGMSSGLGAYLTGIAIVSHPSLIGQQFHLQLFCGDLAANAWGRSASNALTLTIGN